MSSMLRYGLSILVAVLISLSAFVLMHRLIATDGEGPAVQSKAASITFKKIEIETVIEPRKPRPPERQPPAEPPPTAPDVIIDQAVPVSDALPKLAWSRTPGIDSGIPGFAPHGGRAGDGDIVPLVRISPQYPREAALNQIEGWVTVEFTITESGTVRNPRVIAAEPPRVFNQEALRAIVRWKFKPRIVDGVAVERSARQTLAFRLGDRD